MDDREHSPEDPQEERPEETAPEGRAEEPTAEQPPSEPPAAEQPGPEAPQSPGDTGPQAPATEATQPLGGGAGAGAGGGAAGEGPRRMLRSRGDRVIGGVCGGLGNYFKIDPLVFRIGAIALVFIGGAGLLLYLAALLLMPNEPAVGQVAQAPAEGRNRALGIAAVVLLLLVAWPFLLGGGILVAGLLVPLAVLVAAGVLAWWVVSGQGPSGEPGDIARRAALGIGVLILCCVVAFFGAWAAAAGPDGLVAGMVIAAGAAIVAGAFLKPVRWLVLPAVVLALSAGAVSAAGIDTSGGTGEREYRPASAAELDDRYELGIGELVVDLRGTSLPAGDVPLRVDVGIGQARVLVPEDVCVTTDAEIGMGQADVFERGNGGIDVDFKEGYDAPPDTTRLVLGADIGVGHLLVSHTDVDWDDHDRGEFFNGGGNEAGNEACSDSGQRVSD